ncbi:hypothetical protein ACXR2U_04835 [Jatrophihabitans sp. YIM 134969]
MADDELSLRLDADVIGLPLFAHVVSDVIELLTELSAEVVGKDQVHWVLDSLTRNSPATITARPVETEDAEEILQELEAGLVWLNEGVGWPSHFSERALDRVRSISRRTSDTVQIEIGRPSTRRALTTETAAHVDHLLAASVIALGSVEGRLESVTVHQSPEFSLYDLLTGRRIRCSFGSRVQLEDVTRNVDRRVSVYGTLRSRADGTVLSIAAESVTPLPRQSDLPHFSTARGILDAG